MNDRLLEDSIELEVLFKAAQKVDSLFTGLPGHGDPAVETGKAESSAREQFRIIHRHLYAMAVAELRSRSHSKDWFLLESVSYESEDIASEAAEIPFCSRGNDGFLDLVNLIRRFFRKTKRSDKNDFFLYLKGITGKNVSSVIRDIYRSEKSLLHYIYTAATRHIRNDPRYSREGDRISDLASNDTGQSLHQASVEDIVSLCPVDLPRSVTPGRMTDIIFDALALDERFSPVLELSVLRMAIFQLISSKFTPSIRNIYNSDPMQEYMQKQMLHLAAEAVSEAAEQYHWRDDGSSRYRDLFIKVAADHMEETIMHAERSPSHEIFARYAEHCTREIYRKVYMGSFQNFWNVAWNNLLNKIRADV
ncbi:MAG: hypothetical protein JW814_02485 [Candidatus Krumholzibacteriota bacterium]|nr:hypothetical protein [Candidatus Krumholzibacteriota bacterium]